MNSRYEPSPSLNVGPSPHCGESREQREDVGMPTVRFTSLTNRQVLFKPEDTHSSARSARNIEAYQSPVHPGAAVFSLRGRSK